MLPIAHVLILTLNLKIEGNISANNGHQKELLLPLLYLLYLPSIKCQSQLSKIWEMESSLFCCQFSRLHR